MVIYVSDSTDGFELINTRITANSFLGGWGPGTARDRQSNFTWGLNDNGALLTMLGTNYLVENNDRELPFNFCSPPRGLTFASAWPPPRQT